MRTLLVLVLSMFALIGVTQLAWRGPNNLPHRPLREIDIQGHQPTGRAPTGDKCPGQYGYYLPSEYDANGVLLFCWGAK